MFMKLTRLRSGYNKDGNDVLVNTDLIRYFEPADNHCLIVFIDGDLLTVQENFITIVERQQQSRF